MPYANKEAKAENGLEYYAANKEAIKERERKKYSLERETIRKRRRELNTDERREQNSERERIRHAAYRNIVINAYGGKCACCGETEPLFLEIDHINNDGNKHRAIIGTSGRIIIYWIIRNNFPADFQILCSNCNQGKRRNGGICPHSQR